MMNRDQECEKVVEDCLTDLTRNANFMRTMYDRKFYDITRLAEMRVDYSVILDDIGRVMEDMTRRKKTDLDAFKMARDVGAITVIQINVINALMSGGKIRKN